MSELSELAWAWRLNNDEAALLYSISKAQKSNRSEVRILLMHTGVTGSLLNAVGELFSNGSITVVEHRGDGVSSLSKLGDIRANVSSTTVRDQVELHRLIAASGPFNLIVDVMCGLGTAYRQRLFSLFFPALVDGGCFLLAGLDKMDTEELRDVIGFYGRLASLVAGTDASAAGDVRALSQLIQTLSIGRGVIALERRGESLVKLRHGEVEMILSARFGSRWGRTLARRGARKYDSSTLKWTNRPAVAESRLMATVRCPEIAVREYSDVAVRPRQIISRENLLYPDTFRLGGLKRLRNTALTDVNHYYAALADQEEPAVLPGTFFHLDLEYNKHFGHFMTEAVPRFYGWDIAREEYPDVKVLTNSHSNNGRPAEYQMALFNAYGIADEDIVVIDRPVKVERLVCAAPLFENMRFAHPDLAQTFRRIGSSFEGAGPVRPGGRRIFVSRRPGMWRECVNRDEVEALFIEQGFDVVLPETLTLREQALLFRGCDIVAGYIGSAMYNLMFADRPVKVLGIVGESYVATNEYLINTVVGNPMAIVYGVDIVNGRKTDCDGRLLGSTNLDYRVELSAIQDALRALGEG